MTAPAAARATKVDCCICNVSVRRFTESTHPMCQRCGDNAFLIRRDLEREGVLPKHSRFNLTNVYTHPLVLERARAMRRAS